MTVHDRIKLVVKWLIGTGVARNQESIGRLMGYSNKSSFSQILNDKVSLPNDFIDRLCSLNENINFVWVKDGIGNMITDIFTSNSPSSEDNLVPDISLNRSDTITLRLLDKLDEKDNIISEKEAKIDQLQAELRLMSEELATLKAKYREDTPDHVKGLGPSETAKDAHTRKHTPGSEHYSDRTNPQIKK